MVLFISRQVAEKMKKKKEKEAQTVPCTQTTSDAGDLTQSQQSQLQATFAVLDADLGNTSSSQVNITTNNSNKLIWNY